MFRTMAVDVPPPPPLRPCALFIARFLHEIHAVGLKSAFLVVLMENRSAETLCARRFIARINFNLKILFIAQTNETPRWFMLHPVYKLLPDIFHHGIYNASQ